MPYSLDPSKFTGKYGGLSRYGTTSVMDVAKRSVGTAEDILLGTDAHATKYKIGLNDQPIDADTIAGGRLTGYDAFESVSGTEKSRKLEEMGIPLEEQKRLGLLGKEQLQEWLLQNQGAILSKEGKDVYGRNLLSSPELAQHMVESGYAVPTNRYDEKLQSIYRAKQEKINALDPSLGKALETQREYNIRGQEPGFLKRMGSAVDAFQSGTQQALAGTADFALDLLTPGGDNTLLNKAKSAEYANKVWGYDARESNFQKQEALHNFKNEKYVDSVIGMAKSPELWGESLPMMAEMMLGAGKFTKLGKAIELGTKGLQGAEKVTEAKKIRDGATALQKATLLGAQQAGFLATVGDQTNRHIEEFTQNNDMKEPSASQIAEMTVMNVFQLGLDRMVFGELIGARGGIDALKDVVAPMLKVVPENRLVEIGMQVARSVTGVTAAMGTEAAQEYVQTWAELLNTRAGTKKYGDWKQVLMNAESQDEAIVGALAGAGMGAQMRVPTELTGGVNKLSEAIVGKTVADINKEQQASEIETAWLNDAVDSKRVKYTDDMTPEQRDSADMINQHLDSVYEMYQNDPTNKSGIVEELKLVDGARSSFGFDVKPTESAKTDETVQPTEEAQVSKEYSSEVNEKIKAAGLVDVLTKNEKMGELNVEPLHDTGTQVADASKKKSKLVSTFNMNEDVISDILAGNMNEDIASTLTNTKDGGVVNFAKRLGYKLSPANKDVFQALTEMATKVSDTVATNPEAKEAMEKLFGKSVTKEKAVRVAALVVDTVHSAMRSEFDINEKYKLGNEKVSEARRQEVAHQLGKELMNSFELRLTGKPKEMAMMYTELGEAMLTIGEKSGLVEMGTKNVAIHNLVDEQGNRLTAKEAKKYYQSVKPGTVQVPTVKVKGITKTDRGATTLTTSAANAMSKLFKPINYELPSETAVEEVPTMAGTTISKEHEKIIQDYNKLKYSIKPQALKVLKEVKQYIQTKYDGNTDKALSSDRMLKNLLGLQKSDATIRQNTEGGKAIGRKGTLINLLDNLEYLEQGDLHFNFESAINQRIHVMQTVLDFQGDKYMARQILQGGSEPKTVKGLARKLLINNLADELKTSKEEVENPTDKRLINAMDTIEKTGTIPMNELPRLAKALGVKTPFKALSLITAMNDVRNSKGGPVTTNYQVESDATASGVVNTLLNLSGYPKVQAILEVLGVGTKEKGTDPYKFIAEVLSKHSMYETDIKPLLEKLNKVGLDARNVAKYPIMKWFYGQLDANNNADMGEDIAQNLIDKALYEYNQDAMDLINEVLGTDYAIDSDTKTTIANITAEDQKKLGEYYSKNLAEFYTEALNKEFAEVGGYRNKMGDIYKMLKNTGTWEGKIGTAMGALLGTPGKDKMSVQKLKQMIFTEGNDTYTTNQYMDNETSFNVNLQHATDAALLLMSIRDILGDVVDSGVMTVHDALYSDAETALKIMNRYNHYTKEAALKYDYMDTALSELKEAISKMEDTPLKKQYQAKYEAMKAENDKVMEAKAQYLSGKELNILGDWEVGQELADERSKNPSTETKTETKSDVVTENTNTQETISARIKRVLTTDGIKRSEIASFISSLEVSKEYEGLKVKVVEALNDPSISFKHDQKYQALPGKVMMGTKGTHMDQRFSEKGTEYSAETFISTMAHEIDHAYQMGYILGEGKNSTEVKYITKVLEKFNSAEMMLKLTPKARKRMQYIQKSEKEYGYGVVELAAVLANEPDVANEIQAVASAVRLIDRIKDLIQNVINWAKGLTTEQREKILQDGLNSKITVKNVQIALVQLDSNVRVNTGIANAEGKTVNPAGITSQKDLNVDMFLNPLNYVNDAVAKTNRFASDWMIIWGNEIDAALSPKLMKAHMKMKHSYPIYREMVSLLRTGFYDSEFAQKMHYLLGLAGDVSDKVIKESLGLFTKYQQESAKRREAMAEMDRQLTNNYSKKDRLTVHRLFADTGIANLVLMPEVKDALLNGTKDVKTMLANLEVQLDAETVKKLEEVAEYWVTGNTQSRAVNVRYAENESNEAYVYATLKAISMIKDGEKLLQGMDKDLQKWMMSMALANKQLNDQINEKKADIDGNVYSKDSEFHSMYDGSYSMDIHEKIYEYRTVSTSELRSSKYSKENGWIVIRDANGKKKGLVARERLDGGRTPGLGLEANRYANGAFLSMEQSQEIFNELEGLTQERKEEWLNLNQMVQDGNRFRVLLDKETKREKLGMMENAAHSLYRTYIHNQELIQSETIRNMMLERGTTNVRSLAGMKNLEATLRENDRKGVRGKLGAREVVSPFVSIDYTSPDLEHIKSFDDLAKEFPMIAKYFKTPTGITSFNGFNSKVSLVKRGVADVVLGHKNFSIFGESDKRELAKAEMIFKKMIVLAKQKMVVANPIKLMNDSITNLGLLSMMDIGIAEIYSGMRDGFDAYKEYARERSKYVELQMEAEMQHAMAKMDGTEESKKKANGAKIRRDKQLAKLETLEFHDAFNYGFVQSYSTDLVIKEFDTITGIQQDIDTFIDKYTHDKKGNPNKLFEAVKWWQSFGYGLDDMFRTIGETAKMKGTDTGTELVELADRLSKKKADKESVARYLSDVMGSPASEVVNYGSAYMVLADALSKYVLAKHLMTQENPRGERGNRKKYTKEEAYSIANDTFVDYRTNLPAEIKALSDYGIMMFPAFWMKIQRTIGMLLKYHPVSSGVSYGIELGLGMESYSIMNQNMISKFYFGNQDVLNAPWDALGSEALIAVL